jgi:hypothetical protein
MNDQQTGVRGYLLWLKREQPGIYKVVAPQIAQLVPDAFSNREQSDAQGALMGLAETTGAAYGTDVADAADTGAASPSVTNTILGLVSTAAQVYGQTQLAKQQFDMMMQVNQAQLDRVKAGLPAGDFNMQSLGIPQIHVGLDQRTLTGGGIALGIVVALGLAFMLKPKHA